VLNLGQAQELGVSGAKKSSGIDEIILSAKTSSKNTGPSVNR